MEVQREEVKKVLLGKRGRETVVTNACDRGVRADRGVVLGFTLDQSFLSVAGLLAGGGGDIVLLHVVGECVDSPITLHWEFWL